MSHHLDNLVKIDASSWQAFWYCSLRNPLKAPTWAQVALSTISFFVGGFFFVAFTKAWDVKIEDGKYQLLNPREFASSNDTSMLAKAALKVEKLSILRVVFENHCRTFMDVLDEKYEKFKDYQEFYKFSLEEKKELAQMRKLYDVVRKAQSKNQTMEKLLDKIERDIAPIWKKVLDQQEEVKTL